MCNLLQFILYLRATPTVFTWFLPVFLASSSHRFPSLCWTAGIKSRLSMWIISFYFLTVVIFFYDDKDVFNIPLYFTSITTYIYIYNTELAPKLTATASVTQSLEHWSRVAGSIPSRRPWSCIFHNWFRLRLTCKMYIFLTLEFTLL